MQINSRKLTNILLLLISLAAWWFTASQIKPELQYFLQQTAFLTDRLFFQGYARYPGGIADYLSVFVGQFFHFNKVGSFLIILVAALQGFIAMNLVKRVSGKENCNFSIFTLILIGSIWVQCDYHYPFYASFRLFIASVFVWILTVLTQKFPSIHFYLAFVLASFIFYIAGGAALFVFTASAICRINICFWSIFRWFIPSPIVNHPISCITLLIINCMPFMLFFRHIFSYR